MSTESSLKRSLLLAVAVCAACDGVPSLPAGPSSLTRGVILYEHANFLGNQAHLESSLDDLSEFDGPCYHSDGDTDYFDWNDCISSIRVAPGWRAVVFEHDEFDGDRLEIVSDVANLQLVAGSCDHEGLNDCVTSIKVIAPGMPF